MHVIRGDRCRPDDPVLVVALLDRAPSHGRAGSRSSHHERFLPTSRRGTSRAEPSTACRARWATSIAVQLSPRRTQWRSPSSARIREACRNRVPPPPRGGARAVRACTNCPRGVSVGDDLAVEADRADRAGVASKAFDLVRVAGRTPAPSQISLKTRAGRHRARAPGRRFRPPSTARARRYRPDAEHGCERLDRGDPGRLDPPGFERAETSGRAARSWRPPGRRNPRCAGDEAFSPTRRARKSTDSLPPIIPDSALHCGTRSRAVEDPVVGPVRTGSRRARPRGSNE